MKLLNLIQINDIAMIDVKGGGIISSYFAKGK